MSVAAYAAHEQRQGAPVVEAGSIYWRRVRPFFYRPLLPFKLLEPDQRQIPSGARWGGYQHAVPDAKQANSILALLMFRDASTYRLENLDKKRRWEVRSAARLFKICPLATASELAAAHPVYADFLRRTGYRFRSDRAQPEKFREWAEAVFAAGRVAVLGAFQDGELQAVSIAPLVEQTLIYATFFARESALKQHVASLMLHTLRELAAGQGGIGQIYVGMRKFGKASTVDRFYQERGCETVCLPAWYRFNPLIACLLRFFLPRRWAQITGSASAAAKSAENRCLSSGWVAHHGKS